MDLNYLKKLIKMLDSSNLSEIEIEEEGTKIRLSKPKQKIATQLPTQIITPYPSITNINPQPAEIKEKPEPTTSTEEFNMSKIFEVKAPMVGTFYRSPSPEAKPYVDVGSTVKEGTVLCIIEAMKLMNEIESEVGGKIVKILVENGQPVEYNQVLFYIEKP